MVELKVLTLNCWGVFVPFACKNRKERIREIGNTIGQGVYDVVFLQEIWTQADYLYLCEVICPSLPYAHYFLGGIIGSGLCIFSKHVILETSQYRFSLNGYAHRIFCGDWMGGKSVGLAKLMIQPMGIKVNAYNTHLHAQYSPDNSYNSYDEHRCLQAFEMAKFIRDTSSGCDVVIVGGDLNTSPNQIGYEILKSVANLKDSWKTQLNTAKAVMNEPTCERPDNSFGPTNTHCNEGVRIDFLFHRQNFETEVICKSCDLEMRKIPKLDLSYSDHEGIGATYIISKHSSKYVEASDGGMKYEKCLEEGISVLEKGMKKARKNRKLWLMFSLFLGCILFALLEKQRPQMLSPHTSNCLEEQKFLGTVHQSNNDDTQMNFKMPSKESNNRSDHSFYFVEFLKIAITIGFMFSLIHSLIVLTKEMVTFKSVQECMKQLIKFSA